MQINLNKESWHARYYRFASESDRLPKSLCPYFWSLVFLLVTFPVIVLIKIVDHIVNTQWNSRQERLEKMDFETRESYFKREKKREEIMVKSGKAFVGLLLLFIGVVLVMVFAMAVEKLGWVKALLSFLGSLGGIFLFGYVWFIFITRAEIGEWLRKSIIVIMIRSAYEKACPLISWTKKARA